MRTNARRFAAAVALAVALLSVPAMTIAADGADYGACVAHHARSDRGFTEEHNPGMHTGFEGWRGCPVG